MNTDDIKQEGKKDLQNLLHIQHSVYIYYSDNYITASFRSGAEVLLSFVLGLQTRPRTRFLDS